MVKCNFCGKEITNPATRFIYVTKRGRVYNFCSGKCRKNFLLGRDPRKIKWSLYRKHRKSK
ncbi:MAG: TRASH domain-containing protein [Candidatus Njordarchaeota archaeon]